VSALALGERSQIARQALKLSRPLADGTDEGMRALKLRSPVYTLFCSSASRLMLTIADKRDASSAISDAPAPVTKFMITTVSRNPAAPGTFKWRGKAI